MGQIKVRGKLQRVAVINDNRVVARAVHVKNISVSSDFLKYYLYLCRQTIVLRNLRLNKTMRKHRHQRDKVAAPPCAMCLTCGQDHWWSPY